ncbi:MAG: tetratricopeptide repeat protein, partial [Planctomycetota bacterium]
MHFLAILVFCCSAGGRAGAADEDHAETVVRLAEVESSGGTRTGELRLVASREGKLIAWIDGEGSGLSLGVESAAGDELEHVEQDTPRTPARIELSTAAGATYVIRWEADDARPWAWLRVHARVTGETPLTRDTARIAREALGLGRELAAKGDLEAQRALIEGAISEISALAGISDSRTAADALWSLGFPAFSSGALESALAASTLAMQIRGRFEPLGSRLVQVCRIGTSIVLAELQRLGDAARVGAQVEAVYAFALSEDDPELAKVRLNLANYLRLAGELDRPAVLIGRALEVYECQLPIESEERQRATEIAAELDAALGRSEQAAARFRELYRLALQSKDQEKLQATAGNYAIVLSDCGELEMAREIEEANLERAERRLPKSHPGLIRLRENLAVTLLNLGDLPRARVLLEQSLAALEDHEDSDRSGLVRVLCNFGELERRAGNFPRARELFERAVTLTAEIEDKNFAALPLNGLAQTLLAAGDSGAALPILEGLVAQRSASFGDANLYTQSARISLAECLLVREDFQRAGEL